MNKPLLSILICSIPSRWSMATSLYARINSMVGDKDIEVLLFMDNKKRTIGEKREAIKNISNGLYFMMIDDDDDLFSVDEIYEACSAIVPVDVITFKIQCQNADGSKYVVTSGLGNEIEHNSVNGNYVDMKRPPFMQSAWHERFKNIRYPKMNYNEDGIWCSVANEDAKTEIHIDKILAAYNFNPKISEATL